VQFFGKTALSEQTTMTKAVFQDPIFHHEDKARQALEAVRWPDGPICPHCGNSDQEKLALIEGQIKSHRPGLRYCVECKGQFTVTVGTVFERSKIPLSKWWTAAHMMNSNKNGVSAHEIHRNLGVTYKTAWFMMHRLREAMIVSNPGPLGGEGKSVQADETYYGNTSKCAKGYKKGHKNKEQVVALVEPGGEARAVHVKSATVKAVREILVTNASRKSELHTDDAHLYRNIGKESAAHKTVGHTLSQSTAKSGLALTVRQLTQSKTSLAFSNAVCAAPIRSAARSICSATSPNLNFVTIIALALALLTGNGRRRPSRVLRASA
jgi:transposase-like protein